MEKMQDYPGTKFKTFLLVIRHTFRFCTPGLETSKKGEENVLMKLVCHGSITALNVLAA